MGKFVVNRALMIFGWAATAVMAAATVLFFASLL
jgi:hypothetical protein